LNSISQDFNRILKGDYDQGRISAQALQELSALNYPADPKIRRGNAGPRARETKGKNKTK